jgi:hypothetical protein
MTVDKEARDKRQAELAEAMPETVIPVGELAIVEKDLRDILANGGDVGAAMKDYIASIHARIEKLDDSGKARAWLAAWAETEEKA